MTKFFGTDGIRGVAGEPPLDEVTVHRLGLLLGGRAGGGRLLLARDPRESGPWLMDALAQGIADGGGNAVRAGVLPTPAVSLLVAESPDLVGGAMISASHNPWRDNGIKLLGAGGRKLTDEEEATLEALLAGDPPPAGPKGEILEEENRWHDRYVERLADSGPSLEGLRLVLDCANGATAGLAEEIVERLGGRIAGVVGDEPNGRNINEGCGSLHPEGLAAAVKAHQADLGCAFDGDGDRVILADEGGEIRDGDDILFVCGLDRARRGALPGSALVGTVMTNVGLETALGHEGIELHRAAVGDRNVLALMEERSLELGGEPSGHVIFRDLAPAGDGILTGLQVAGTLRRNGTSLEEACRGWERCPQVLVNVGVAGRPPLEEVPELVRAVRGAEERLGEAGRVLLRYSGTEPLLRVMVEGPDRAQVRELAEELASTARKAIG